MEQIETNSKLADLNSAEYIVKLNRNKLNIQIKRHRLSNEKNARATYSAFFKKLT